MDLIETLSDAARTRPARVVFPEADEARIVQAMARLGDRGLCVPVTPPDIASDAALQALIDARADVFAAGILLWRGRERCSPCGEGVFGPETPRARREGGT